MSTFVTPNTFLGPVQASFSTALLGIYYLGTTRAYLTCCREGSCSIYWPLCSKMHKTLNWCKVLTAPGLSLHAKLSEQIAKPSKIKMTLVKAKNDNVKHGLWSTRSITALSALRMLCTGLCNVFVAGDNEVHVINLTVRSGRLSAVQSNGIATIWYFPWNVEGLLRKQGKAK